MGELYFNFEILMFGLCSFTVVGQCLRLRFENQRTLEALDVMVSMMVFCLSMPQQCGLSDSVKDLFYDQLGAVTAMIPASEFLIPCDDWNAHVGSTGSSYKEAHGAMGMAS